MDLPELTERQKKLFVLEITRIMEDLEFRRDLLLEIWGRHRDRGPMIDTVFSRWSTLGFDDLALLDSELMVVLDAYYRELEELKLLFGYTEAMPTSLGELYDWRFERLSIVAKDVIDKLGGPPERPELPSFDDFLAKQESEGAE
ncbi:MAG: hypothetical protein HN348_33320 [Proteobacteria bacterium]|jgi:hypothetical protein|nr:hypothetical protein [Pseudomonadota bacterium]